MPTDGKDSYEKLRDILETIQNTNGRVIARLKQLEETSAQDIFRMLVTQLKEHQASMQRTLRTSKKEESENVLDTWIQYVPEEEIDRAADEIIELDVDSIDPLAERTLAYLNAVVSFIRTISEQSSSDEVQEFLDALADREQKAVEAFSKSLLGLRDV